MRMNKKVLTLAGVALTAMSLAACANNGTPIATPGH